MRSFLVFYIALVTQMAAFAQCSNFSIVANKSSICSPDIVRFQLLNPVPGSTYVWNLGQGNTSGADTIFAFYTSAMVVNASVQITLPNGTSCNVTKNNILTVREKPEPQFIASKYKLCNGPEVVDFTDITPNSMSRNWIIDGTNYNLTATKISHQFVTSGSKQVSLIVKDSFGCEGVAQFPDTIIIYPDLQFDFEASQVSGCAPKNVDFSLTKNPNSIYTKSFQWSFPGATNTSDGSSTPSTRTYANPGSFNVQLTVSLSNGCSYTVIKPNLVNLGDSIPLNVSLRNAIVCGNIPVEIEINNDSLPGTISWQFAGINGTVQDSSDYFKYFTVLDSGRLYIDIKHDYNGCISTKRIVRNVWRKGVEASFTSTDNYHCDIPHTVHLWNTSDSMDATSVSYVWNIYKGKTLYHSSTTEHDSLTFNTLPAYYTVELIATGSNGCADTFIKKNFIYQDSLNLKFTPIPKIACVGQAVLFNNTTKPSSYLAPDEFIWTFYGLDDSTVLDTSHEKSPTMVYYDTGFYNVMVTGMNAVGCRDTLIREDAIQIIEPNMNYSVANPIICMGDSFFLTADNAPDAVNYSYKWIFKHKNSQTITVFKGDSLYATLNEPGPYTLYFESSIAQGCLRRDSIDVYINGLEFEIVVDTLEDCTPFTLHPQIDLHYNYHYPSTNSSLFYNWQVLPSNGEVSSGLNSASPTITLVNEGQYVLSLFAMNTTSCTYSIFSDSIRAGVKSNFQFVDSKVCLGDTIFAKLDKYNPDNNYQWESNAANTQEIGIDSVTYGFLVPNSGNFELKLVVSKDNICSDSSKHPFQLIRVIANFNSNDTFLQCAPVYVQFLSSSINADSLIWDFGDGTSNVTTSPNAGTIYKKNTGPVDGYDIQLIAKSNEGCLDTALKEDYIIVKGPIPKFSMLNATGCEPLEVQFLDSSQYVSRFFLNYNDGSDLDSSSIATHTYYNTSSSIVQKIWPSLFVYDSLGCGAVYNSPKPVTIYKKPYAGFKLDYDSGQCIPYKVRVEDTGSFAIQSEWLLNGALYSGNKKDSIFISTAGNNEITLITTNKHYCSDTASQFVFVSGIPELKLHIIDTVCLLKTVRFVPEIVSDANTDTSGMKLWWNFGEQGTPGNTVEGTGQQQFTYLSGGMKNIVLRSQLSNNCGDSIQIPLYVRSESDIDTVPIHRVSYTDNYSLLLDFEPTDYDRFYSYEISSTTGRSWSRTTRIDTTVVDVYLTKPDVAMCYDVHILDKCDLKGAKSVQHCAIALNVTSIVPFENVLNWTPYIGWPSVKSYAVYRKEVSDPTYQLIAVVDGSTLEYRDTNLCQLEYFYYVEASHPNYANIRSRSYELSQIPMYAANPNLSSIKNVSVAGHNLIEIKWNKSPHNRWDHYVLNKYINSEAEYVGSFNLKDTFYLDHNVLTGSNSYVYSLQEVDICNEINQADREGKSILLQAYYDKSSFLNWTFYRRWLNGVSQYHVELLHQGNNKLLGTTPSNQNTYVDAEYHGDVFGPYCYRVYGINDIADTSYSNIVCVQGDPLIHMPNAFSPNADGHNETFRPITAFVIDENLEGISSYYFGVYNRWGEKLFETTDIRDSWDGNYKGEACQQDVYIFRLSCEGVNGQQYNVKGSVTLLR